MTRAQDLITGRRARRVVAASVLAVSTIGIAGLADLGTASAGAPVNTWIDPTSSSPGGIVTVHGDCTPPFIVEARVVVMSTAPGWVQQIYAMNTPDGAGVFSGSFTLPNNAPFGSYTVQIQCGQGSNSFTSLGDYPLTVAAAPTTTTTAAPTEPTTADPAVAAATAAATSPTFTG
jgi:hypothetical protein